MEKWIQINGISTKFKTNGVALLIYKSQFGRNLIPDLLSLVNYKKASATPDGEADASAELDINEADISRLDVETLYNICWTFAKIADPNIPPVMEWLGQFDSFPVMDVFVDIQPLLMECITCRAEVKKAQAAAGLSQIAGSSKRKTSFFRLGKQA